MGSHMAIMHFALSEGKRLLHYPARYAFLMETPNERLRAARAKKFDTAIEAAEAMGIPASTYIGHENGHRGFPAKRAPQYARKFGVSEEWLLYGKGDAASGPMLPTEDQLAQMLALARDEMEVGTPYGGWPRAVASSLRAQLERFLEYGLAEAGQRDAPVTSPGKSSRSRRPTKPDARG